MTELCSEFQNMNISREYFSFIKDIYSDFIKYIKQYKTIASEYTKKMQQLQEKYSFQLMDLNKSKKKYSNIHTKFIFSITSTVPRILSQLIQNMDLFINQADTTIKTLENTIKEKTTAALKYQEMYDESRVNLLKNYKNIDKYKELFMNSMSNSEDIILKYYNNKININEEKNKKEKKEKEKIEKKITKIKNTFDLSLNKEQMNTSISNSKKLEIQYKNAFESTEKLEQNFNKLAEEATVNVKKLSCELIIKLKDIILDFVVLLKNSYKMPLSEIDIQLPKLSNFENNSTYEKKINESYILNKKLTCYKLIKYKLKCFCIPSTIDEKYNPNNHIVRTEDGYEELSFIDDKPTFLTIKEMNENFDLIDIEEMDLKLEEEKIKVRELTLKLLSFDKKPISDNNILLSENEIKELDNSFDKHYNRVLFLQALGTFRSKGIYSFPIDLYDLMYKFFTTIINTIARDKDFHSAKNIIILSQTYYFLENGKKKYLQEKIKNSQLFQSSNFWKEYLEYSIEKEIIRSINHDTKNGTLIKDSKKESDELYGNIVFSQLVPITDNMIDFGLDRKTIREIIKPIIKHYNMNEQSINIIDDVIHKNSERKSVLLNEEIKQIDIRFLYSNYKNFDRNSKIQIEDENMCDKISIKNEVDLFNLENIYEDNDDNKANDEDNKDNLKIDDIYCRESAYLVNKYDIYNINDEKNDSKNIEDKK